jgi:hypothetical protein
LAWRPLATTFSWHCECLAITSPSSSPTSRLQLTGHWQVLDYLEIPVPEDEDLDQVLPVGDMSIFADLGIDEMELGALSGDLDLFPDEVLASLARRIGFGQALERALDSAIGAS